MERVKTITIHTNVYVTPDILAKTVNVITVLLKRVPIMVPVLTDKIPTRVSVTQVIREMIVNTLTALEIIVKMVQRV